MHGLAEDAGGSAQVVVPVLGQGVESDDPRVQGPGEDLGALGRELRLHEDHGHVLLSDVLDELGQFARAGLLARDLDGNLGQVVSPGEVAPGRVEDHEPALLRGDRLQYRPNLGVETVQLGLEGLAVCAVCRCVGRVHLCESVANVRRLDLDQGRVQPDVRVEPPVIVLLGVFALVMPLGHGQLVDSGVGANQQHVLVHGRDPIQPGVLESVVDGEIGLGLGQRGHLLRTRLVGVRARAGFDHDRNVGQRPSNLIEEVSLGQDGGGD